MDITEHSRLIVVLAFIYRLYTRFRAPLKFVFAQTPIAMFAAILLVTWSWRMALVVIVAIAAHELSHAIVFRTLGLGLKHIRFYVLYAETVPAKPIHSNVQLGYASLAGPAGGLFQAELLMGLYWIWPSSTLPVIVAVFTFINLLNCAPILVLDGGGIWAALVSPLKVWLQWVLTALPVVLVLAYTVWFQLWGLLFGLLLAVEMTVIAQVRANRKQSDPEADKELDVNNWPVLPRRHVAWLAVSYALTVVGLVSVYLVATHATGFSWSGLK